MRFNIYRAGEQDLLDGCLRGDRIAQKRLYDLYAPAMYSLCLRYMKDSMLAEDVLVTAFTRILERIHQYTGEGSLEGWIKTTVVREALSTLRKNNRMRFENDPDNLAESVISQPADNTLETEDLLLIIQQLPNGYRTVFNMYAIDGYSHKEIASQLQISENTSKSQLSRARVLLQEMLAKQDPYPHQKRNGITI